MSEEIDLKKVARVLATADGGCSNCVHELIKVWLEEFPETNKEEFKKAFREIEKDHYWIKGDLDRIFQRIEENRIMKEAIDE